MKPSVAISLIAFVSIAVFGFVGLTHDSIFSACAMAVMSPEANCPVEPTAETSLLHAQIFQSFSDGLLASLIILLISLAAFFGLSISPALFESQYISHNFEISSSPGHYQAKFINWLKILAKEDTFAT